MDIGHVPFPLLTVISEPYFQMFGQSDLTPFCSKRCIYVCLVQNDSKIKIDKNGLVPFLQYTIQIRYK